VGAAEKKDMQVRRAPDQQPLNEDAETDQEKTLGKKDSKEALSRRSTSRKGGAQKPTREPGGIQKYAWRTGRVRCT